jgi:preprotein translocase subunit SecB
LHSQADSFEKGLFEVAVTATVTARVGDKVMFLIEVKQAGVFHVNNIPAKELEQVLAVTCPNILFPYLREVVSDISVRAGFAPVLLNPINFEVLYEQQKIQAAAGGSTTTH